MKKTIILSASPKKGEPSVSASLAELAKAQFENAGLKADIIDVGQSLKNSEPVFEAMRSADAMLIIFPLYFFCLPGMLMRFLEDYAASAGAKQAGQKIYTIVNCGFPEPGINEEAIRVTKSFAHHTEGEFGFGVAFGSGGMALGAKDAPFMKKPMGDIINAMDRMASEIVQNTSASSETLCIGVSIPRWMYFLGGNVGWHQMAKKNGLKKRDLYRTPYRAN